MTPLQGFTVALVVMVGLWGLLRLWRLPAVTKWRIHQRWARRDRRRMQAERRIAAKDLRSYERRVTRPVKRGGQNG